METLPKRVALLKRPNLDSRKAHSDYSTWTAAGQSSNSSGSGDVCYLIMVKPIQLFEL